MGEKRYKRELTSASGNWTLVKRVCQDCSRTQVWLPFESQ